MDFVSHIDFAQYDRLMHEISRINTEIYRDFKRGPERGPFKQCDRIVLSYRDSFYFGIRKASVCYLLCA